MSSGQSWPDDTTRRAALELLGGLVIMAMIPENPLVGGTVLQRAAIQSPNYSAGASGWIIRQDGSVEFNSGTFRGQIVGGGLFIYNGAPALGNPPVLSVVAPGVTQDPYGNAVAPVLEAGAIGSNFTQVDQAGDILLYASNAASIILNPAKQAIFVYQPSVALGNLVASMAATRGTDSAGNAYLDGVTSYLRGSPFQAAQSAGGQFTFWNAAAAGGPWNPGPTVQGYPHLVMSDQNLIELAPVAGIKVQIDNGLAVLAGGATVAGTLTADQTLISDSRSTSYVLRVVNKVATNTAIVRIESAGASDSLLGMEITGDTQPRILFDINASGIPAMHFGPGNAATDCQMFRVGTGLIASTPIAFQANGNVEAWVTATLLNGWTQGTGAVAGFRRVAAPEECIQYTGRLVAPAGIVAGQAVWNQGTSYRPVSVQSVLGVNVNTGAMVRFQQGTGGNLNYQSGAVAGDAIDLLSGNLVQQSV